MPVAAKDAPKVVGAEANDSTIDNPKAVQLNPFTKFNRLDVQYLPAFNTLSSFTSIFFIILIIGKNT